MSAEVLRAFSRLNLIDYTGEDERLIKLTQAAKSLSHKFAKSPELALPVLVETLRMSKDDSVFEAGFQIVADAIENVWPTYHGAYKGGAATNLYRGVTLQAMLWAIEKQRMLGVAVSLLMQNWLPHIETKKILEPLQLVTSAADAAYRVELDAVTPKAKPPKPNIPRAPLPKVDRTALQARMDAAVGPANRHSVTGENPNPQWSNSAPAWSYDFADRMTALIGDYLDNVLGKVVDADTKNLSSIAAAIASTLEASSAGASTSVKLLWWRQALYSESAEKPYRALTDYAAVIHAVSDLSPLVESAYEPALESFLEETIRTFVSSTKKIAPEVAIKDDGGAAKALQRMLKLPACEGLVIRSLVGAANTEPLVNPSLTHPKMAVWLLREVEAMQAVADPYNVPDEVEEASK